MKVRCFGLWLSNALALTVGLAPAGDDPGAATPALEQRLRSEGAEALAAAARAAGDPVRGAMTFYQPYLACTRCHLGDGKTPTLGPDLATLGKEVTGGALVESILDPSQSIRKGFETVAILTTAGKTVTGRLVEERADAIVLRDPAPEAPLVTIKKADIDVRNDRGPSLMPAGLANQLPGGRQEFLDLIRYLMEIAEQGPARAAALRPDPALLVAPPLPDYENDVDHAGIVGTWNSRSNARGEQIYVRVCANCHGTKDQPGSLPTSLRFAAGVFKNGSDPWRMYQTLTRGFGQMAPQSWMVPTQKYDVIHYIREAYLREDNPTQYARVDPAYLATLPKGTTRGPAPLDLRPWVTMDYGPSLMATLEIGDDSTNFAYKGIAVRLDPGPGGISRGRAWTIYDHDTLRHAASWTGESEGFIDWKGINFNGQHEVHPQVLGLVHLANPTGPGWADPATGRFDDPRPRGRDGRPYGPLPRAWAHYQGLYHQGSRVVVAYTVGETPVLETPGIATPATGPSAASIFTRSFHIGPRPKDMLLQVANVPGAAGPVRRATGSPGVEAVVFGVVGWGESAAVEAPFEFDGATGVVVAQPEDFDLAEADYTITARIKTSKGGTLFARAPESKKWARGGKALFVRKGRLIFDIAWVGDVTSQGRVDDDHWHDVAVAYEHRSGRTRLFIDGRLDGEGRLKPTADVAKHVVRVGYTAPDFPEGQTYFAGQMAEVGFHDRALAPDELGAGGGGDHVVARWRFDLAGDGRIPDRAGRGHDARSDQARPAARRQGAIAARIVPALPGFEWRTTSDGHLRLKIPAGTAPLDFSLRLAGVTAHADIKSLLDEPVGDRASLDVTSLTRGGTPHWPTALTAQTRLGRDDGPFAVDVLTQPDNNPWLCQMRLTGFDFFPGGRHAAVCTWDGDVWNVDGVDDPGRGLTWRRIASGLFQPLGLKIKDGAIHVGCRDQICILRDVNGDGETDFYENFNSDHQVTEHFHEFAMDLETDALGNFYYAKAARHGKTALVPQHGTLLRVTPDGRRTDILASGFRAPNGVCLNPDGTFFLTDQEGFWTPKNRINWVRLGGFYGNMWGYHDVTDPSDSAMEQPVCWITNKFDRSPAQIVRVEGAAWGPLEGTLLNLSYGYGKIFVVPHEVIDGQMQGGMSALPIPQFPTGIMRGRFHRGNGQLYACGMFAWAGTQSQPGGFYRVRATGKPVWVPVGLAARKDGVAITFSGPLDPVAAAQAQRYTATTWGLKRTEKYGSDHFDERPSPVRTASLSADGRTVLLAMPEIAPTWCMEITYSIKGADGSDVKGAIHQTIHQLRDVP